MYKEKNEYVRLRQNISDLMGCVKEHKKQLNDQTQQLNKLLDSNLEILESILDTIRVCDERKRAIEIEEHSLFDNRMWD